MQATSFTFRPLAAQGVGFFQSSRATELSGIVGGGMKSGGLAPVLQRRSQPAVTYSTRTPEKGIAGLGDSGPLGFIPGLDSIINAAAGVATGIANAFAAGAVAGEQTKQQVAIAQANAAIAQANAQAAMYGAQSRTESIKAAAPWVGAAIIGVGILVALRK